MTEEEEKTTEEVALTEEKTAQLTKFEDFSSMDDMLEFAETMIDSGLLPKAYNKPEKVVAAIVQGRELGLDAMTSINNLNVIQGKPTLSVHAIAALLKKSGVRYEIVEDFVAIKDEGGKTLDIVTTIKFYEYTNGRWFENKISFKWSEAKAQGLTTKDNWQRMPNLMMRARCLAIGARFAAPDALMGLYETSEMADVANISYEIIDEQPVIVQE